ncbi:unnamed protein product [Cuscuta epithymum]|uniref:Chromo domain-containing protein n=1 Tax=Cuscuta epithymum TaxID=186058 RepID=A0AAV0GA49_9ASTE|nr:unnamed protein product [Cuscuta epithymum]
MDKGSRLEPVAVLARQMVKVQNQAKVKFLIQWQGQDMADATWEWADIIKTKFPSFYNQMT